jgi:hypothetical protein
MLVESAVSYQFSQFYRVYPTGGLIAELLTMHEGLYVVRASVQIGGLLLATGMAASASIEDAEDRAKLRALTALGIDPSPAPTPWMTAPFNASSGSVAASPSTTSTYLPIDTPPTDSSSHLSITPDFKTSLHPVQPQQAIAPLPSPPLTPTESPHPSFSEASSDEMNIRQDTTSDHSEKPSPTPSPKRISKSKAKPSSAEENFPPEDVQEAIAPAKPEPSMTIALPYDRSDDIAKIEVEMGRLGWSKRKGASYLEETYGKRTRQELSDDELMEFLQFLEEQPTSKDLST